MMVRRPVQLPRHSRAEAVIGWHPLCPFLKVSLALDEGQESPTGRKTEIDRHGRGLTVSVNVCYLADYYANPRDLALPKSPEVSPMLPGQSSEGYLVTNESLRYPCSAASRWNLAPLPARFQLEPA